MNNIGYVNQLFFTAIVYRNGKLMPDWRDFITTVTPITKKEVKI